VVVLLEPGACSSDAHPVEGTIHMTLEIDRLAVHPGGTVQTTQFEMTRELSTLLRRGGHGLSDARSWDGGVLVCLEVDGEDSAVVEVQCGSVPGCDNLATVEQAIAHLEAVRARLLAMQGLGAPHGGCVTRSLAPETG
jgi:hypothetical protein